MIARYGRLPWLVVGFFIPLSALAQPPSALPTADSLATHWKNLLETDAEKAYVAMRRLAATPKETLAFLRETEKPAAPVEAGVIDELIRQLGSDRFAVREKAVQELERHDRHAMEALKKAAQGPIDLETKRRVDALLARQDGRLSSLAARWRRAIEIVEWIGTPEAKGLLEFWSHGAADARLTNEARLSLRRWASRPDIAGVATKQPRFDSYGDPLPAGAVLRLGTARWRFGDLPIERGTIQFTADGRQLVVCDSDSFGIVNVGDGKTVARIPFDASVRSALVNPDRTRMVATGHARDEKGAISPVLFAWDLKNLTKVFQWNVEGTLLGFAKNGEIAVLESDAGLRQVDMKTGQEMGLHPAPMGVELNSEINRAAFNENLMAVSHRPTNRFSIYDLTTPAKVRTVTVPGRPGGSHINLALSPDNKNLAFANHHESPNGGVTIFDVETLQPIQFLAPKEYAESQTIVFDSVEFSPDGKLLAFSSNQEHSTLDYETSSVAVWDLDKKRVRFKTKRAASHLAFSADSRLLAGRAGSGRILIWDATSGKELTGGENEPSQSIYGSTVGFFPDGRGVYLTSREDVALWDFPSGKRHVTLPHSSVQGVALSPNCKVIATGAYFDSLRVWDVASGKERFHVPGPMHKNIFGVAFSANGEHVNVWGDDAVLRSWDAKTGRLFGEQRPRPKNFAALVDDDDDDQDLRQETASLIQYSAFSSRGTRLLWSFRGYHIFDISSGKLLDAIPMDTESLHIKTSADLEWLLTSSFAEGQSICLYNLRDRKAFGQVEVEASRIFARAEMSPDGHCFAVANDRPNRKIEVYETATLQRRLIISMPTGVASEIAFSPTGQYLAAAQSDGTALVYDLRFAP